MFQYGKFRPDKNLFQLNIRFKTFSQWIKPVAPIQRRFFLLGLSTSCVVTYDKMYQNIQGLINIQRIKLYEAFNILVFRWYVVTMFVY